MSEATDLDQNDMFRDQPNPNRDVQRMMKVGGGKTKPSQVRYDEHRIYCATDLGIVIECFVIWKKRLAVAFWQDEDCLDRMDCV